MVTGPNGPVEVPSGAGCQAPHGGDALPSPKGRSEQCGSGMGEDACGYWTGLLCGLHADVALLAAAGVATSTGNRSPAPRNVHRWRGGAAPTHATDPPAP